MRKYLDMKITVTAYECKPESCSAFCGIIVLAN